MQDDFPSLISLNEACRVTSLSRTAINRERALKRFPEAVRITENRIAFVRSEVEAWVHARIASRAA